MSSRKKKGKQSRRNKFQRLLDSADQAYNNGFVSEAREIYERIYIQRPRTRNIERKFGIALRDQGHLSDAIQLLRLAVGRNPSSAKARIALSFAYFQIHDFASAQKFAEDVLRLNHSKKTGIEALNALGEIHSAQGNYGLAQDYYEAAITTNPKDANLYLGLAKLLARLGQQLYAEHQLELASRQNLKDENVKKALEECKKELRQYAQGDEIHPLLLQPAINEGQRPM